MAINNREDFHKRIRLALGEGIIDLEVDPEHIDYAIDLALQRYRMRSSNSVSEAYFFLELERDKQEYKLPDEVDEVQELYRRGTAGISTGGGTLIDPFSLAFNNLYLLRAGDHGGLATYHMYRDYQETVGKLFGMFINYDYNTVTNVLRIHRRANGNETILIKGYKKRSEEELFSDKYAVDWLEHYAVAQTKLIIAEGRTLFSSMPGPTGGTTLNGDSMKADAQAMIDKLEIELVNYTDGQFPMTFLMG